MNHSKVDLKVLDVTTTQQMHDVIIKELNSVLYDIVIFTAAVSDLNLLNILLLKYFPDIH